MSKREPDEGGGARPKGTPRGPAGGGGRAGAGGGAPPRPFRGSPAPLASPVGGWPSGAPVVRESRPPDAPKPRLLDRVRQAIRARHYSRRPAEAYVAWTRRYIFFHGKRH